MKKNLLLCAFILIGFTFSYGQRVNTSKITLDVNFNSMYLETNKVLGGGCDTVGNFDPVTMTPTLYTSTNGGYVAGHNGYGDLGKAEFFMAPSVASTVNGTILVLGAVHAGTSTSTIDVKVWDGSTGEPGTELGSITVLINTLSDSTPNVIMFPTPVNILDDYFIGVTFTYGAGDTIAIVTSEDEEPLSNTGWEMWDDGSWLAYDAPTSWGLVLSHTVWSIECMVVGIDKGLSESNISLFPNPASDHINFVLPADFNGVGMLEVMDISGRTVKTTEITANYSLDISSLTKGLYTVKLTAGDSVILKKFIKE